MSLSVCPDCSLDEGKKNLFYFLNCVVMIFFSLLHMDEHLNVHVLFPSPPVTRMQTILSHIRAGKLCKSPFSTSVSLLCTLMLTWLMTCSLSVTFGWYSNVYIVSNCVNWLTSGCGQVSRLWEAVAELDLRHLFLILWSCVAYLVFYFVFIFYFSPDIFSHLLPCLRGKSVSESLGEAFLLCCLVCTGKSVSV